MLILRCAVVEWLLRTGKPVYLKCGEATRHICEHSSYAVIYSSLEASNNHIFGTCFEKVRKLEPPVKPTSVFEIDHQSYSYQLNIKTVVQLADFPFLQKNGKRDNVKSELVLVADRSRERALRSCRGNPLVSLAETLYEKCAGYNLRYY